MGQLHLCEVLLTVRAGVQAAVAIARPWLSACVPVLQDGAFTKPEPGLALLPHWCGRIMPHDSMCRVRERLGGCKAWPKWLAQVARLEGWNCADVRQDAKRLNIISSIMPYR